MKNKRFFLIILIILLIILVFFLISSCNKESDDLGELNRSCIVVEEKEITMTDDSNGTATISIKMPDYGNLYQQAASSEDFRQFIINALKSGKYNTIEFEETAPVTMEDNNRVIHSEDIIDSLLEQELIDAVNFLMEVE